MDFLIPPENGFKSETFTLLFKNFVRNEGFSGVGATADSFKRCVLVKNGRKHSVKLMREASCGM